MTDTNMTRKDNNHGMPTHYGYRNKDFNDMVNSFSTTGWTFRTKIPQ